MSTNGQRWESSAGDHTAAVIAIPRLIIEPGPGMGFLTLELARLVGPGGRVIAVEVQPRMLSSLKRRAAKAGLLERIDAHLVGADSMGLSDIAGLVDFTLAFAVVHEMPATASFFAQVSAASKTGARVLLAEPAGHVTAGEFDDELQSAARAGLSLLASPNVRRRHAALLVKTGLTPALTRARLAAEPAVLIRT